VVDGATASRHESIRSTPGESAMDEAEFQAKKAEMTPWY
jgi:hypothetical protein